MPRKQNILIIDQTRTHNDTCQQRLALLYTNLNGENRDLYTDFNAIVTNQLDYDFGRYKEHSQLIAIAMYHYSQVEELLALLSKIT